MEEIIIYTAGNPDLYPIEYYDADTETYQGVIPKLLNQFSEQSNYKIKYYNKNSKDERAQLAANRQVDIISGCVESESFEHTEEDSIVVFKTVKNGKPVSYRLFISDAAPESLKADLQNYFSGVTEEMKTGILVDVKEHTPIKSWQLIQTSLISLSLAVLILLTAVILLVRKYRRKLKKYEQNKETDEVTGIGNTDHLVRYYNSLVNDKNRVLYSMFCFYVDTDRMERMSSHQETNEFLKYTAVVLQDYTSETDVLARVSDVGFILLKLSEGQDIDEWVIPALNRIRSFSENNGKAYSCDIAAGVYPLKSDDRDLNEMIFNSWQSAMSAYREKLDYKICSDEMIDHFIEERRLQADINRGFENEEFLLYIQFYVDAHTYQIVGGEALSRWQHPEKGFLTPERFVPLMEREDLISRMDYYSLEKACAFLDRLYKRGIENFFISCNFSRKTFSSADFIDDCKKIIGKHKFARKMLVFEITESASVRNISQVHKNANALKELGIRILLDDFGEGFTSFFDLHEYPVDGLKLDKNLVDNINTEKGNAILKAMSRIGHELNIAIMAEGIESDEQIEELQKIDCDIIQGFRFHYPIPEWEAQSEILKQKQKQ